MQMKGRPCGTRDFVDGTCRPIYEDAQGQYVLDDEGQRVPGQWLLPADEPLFVLGRSEENRWTN
jgi:hypothetical protein